MTIKSNGGIFGRNPTFNIATAAQFVGPISGLATSAEALKSSATTGLMRITGPTAGQTRTMTIPDANFTAARTDAAQSFVGNQTLTDGNLIVSNGKGIDFSATPGSGTSELLADYEEGTWVPVAADAKTGGNVAASATVFGTYTKIGRLVNVNFTLASINTTGMTAGNALWIRNFPFVNNSINPAQGVVDVRIIPFTVYPTLNLEASASAVRFFIHASGGGVDATLVSQVSITSAFYGSITYTV